MNSTAYHCVARLVAIIGLTAGGAVPASAGLLASFENDTEGWTINTTENASYAITGFSTTDGVTDGAYSAIITGTEAPGYGQLLVGPTSSALTAQLATAYSVSIDVTIASAPPAFGFGTQWTAVINNDDLGYVSLDGFTYTGFVGPGGSGTLTWSLTPAQRATLAGSALDSTLIFQVGGGDAGTMYIDNVQLTVPEPTAVVLASFLGAASLMRRRG